MLRHKYSTLTSLWHEIELQVERGFLSESFLRKETKSLSLSLRFRPKIETIFDCFSSGFRIFVSYIDKRFLAMLKSEVND